MTTPTRGMRNNNPGNIRRTNIDWQGEDPRDHNGVVHGLPDDQEFEVFTNPIWGVRALVRLLRTYVERYNLVTIPAIIQRWAPSHENPTNEYADFVIKRTNWPPQIHIDPKDPAYIEVMYDIAQAITLFENGGQTYPVEVWEEGMRLAFPDRKIALQKVVVERDPDLDDDVDELMAQLVEVRDQALTLSDRIARIIDRKADA